MADHEARALRRQITGRERGRGKRYPDALRDQAGAWMKRQIAAGRTIRAAAAAIGIGAETARRWMRSRSTPTWASRRRRSRPRMVPVVVAPAPRTVSVVTPAGFRVDGLAIDEAAALLRALG